MPRTYEAITSTTLGSDTATVTFSSISGSFTDLVLVMALRGASAGTDYDAWFRFNGDTSTNYSRTVLYGDGSIAGSLRNSNMANAYGPYPPGNGATANLFSVDVVHFMSYSNTNVFKTYMNRSNYRSGVIANVGLWRSTSAITSIQIGMDGSSIKAGSTMSLYGIKAA
jgi:hypothetical protein